MKRIDRRSFLKWSAFISGSSLVACPLSRGLEAAEFIGKRIDEAGPAEQIIRTGCPAHNCGGRCLLKVHVRDGNITRIEGDDRPGDTVADPQLRPCIRGRAYRRRQYHPDRLKYPLQRVGKRGEGKFERISWDQAIKRMAAELTRVKDKYGNSAIYVPYGTGSYNQGKGRQVAQRVMNLFGGSLGFYNSYSWA